MNKNLSRKLRLLVELSDELKEANQEANQEVKEEILSDILKVVSTLKRFEKDFAVKPKSKLSPSLIRQANERIKWYKSDVMGISLLQEVEQSYLLWAKGNTCPIRESLYPNCPTAFFQYVCEEMNW